jgi:hypothetical protein
MEIASNPRRAPSAAAATRIRSGRIFHELTELSAHAVPTVALLFGNSTAGGAYVPGMVDYAVLVDQQAKVFLGGPPLVKMATGEQADDESLGVAARLAPRRLERPGRRRRRRAHHRVRAAGHRRQLQLPRRDHRPPLPWLPHRRGCRRRQQRNHQARRHRRPGFRRHRYGPAAV